MIYGRGFYWTVKDLSHLYDHRSLVVQQSHNKSILDFLENFLRNRSGHIISAQNGFFCRQWFIIVIKCEIKKKMIIFIIS